LNTERRAWLAELYESNLSPVFKTCCSVLRNPDDAADASQEVFLIAAHSLQPGTSRAAASAWLQTVARNHSLDVLRRRKRLGRALVTLGADGDSGADPATGVADRDFVHGIFKKLSPRERQALWQSAVEHRPIDDIAGQLRLSYAAAAQVIHRARRRALALAARVAIVFAILRPGPTCQPDQPDGCTGRRRANDRDLRDLDSDVRHTGNRRDCRRLRRLRARRPPGAARRGSIEPDVDHHVGGQRAPAVD